MCNYCSPDDNIFVAEKSYEISGAHGDSLLMPATLDWYVQLEPDKKEMHINFGANNQTVIEESFKIKFCPMCGREL